jgi:hypothetical protein
MLAPRNKLSKPEVWRLIIFVFLWLSTYILPVASTGIDCDGLDRDLYACLQHSGADIV